MCIRDRVYIATKTAASTPEEFWSQLQTSLTNLKTDYIDLYQFHNPEVCPKPGDGSGLYEAMLEAKAQGKIRHIGITNHLSLIHICMIFITEDIGNRRMNYSHDMLNWHQGKNLQIYWIQ